MQSDARRDGSAGANEIICRYRRGMLAGAAAIAAAALTSRPSAGPHDGTLRYLRGEFLRVADRMAAAADKDRQALFGEMVRIAGAMAVIPAGGGEARRAKAEIAAWSTRDGIGTIRLPGELVTALNG
ncbi:UNVERIFIED_ORG: hypothetical protein GGI66_003661 [Rhizobium esperanzae]